MGKPVVMGRKTYLSIGKPLPGRTNIVVSRDPAFAAPGVLVAPSVEAALTAARGDALRRGADEIIVIGGADIYRADACPLPTGCVITHVHAATGGRHDISADRSERLARGRAHRASRRAGRRGELHRARLRAAQPMQMRPVVG